MFNHEATIKAIQAKLRKEEESGLFEKMAEKVSEEEARKAKAGNQGNRSDEADE